MLFKRKNLNAQFVMMVSENQVVVLQVPKATVNANIKENYVLPAEKIAISKFILGFKPTTSLTIASAHQKAQSVIKKLTMKSNGCPQLKIQEEDLLVSMKTYLKVLLDSFKEMVKNLHLVEGEDLLVEEKDHQEVEEDHHQRM